MLELELPWAPLSGLGGIFHWESQRLIYVASGVSKRLFVSVFGNQPAVSVETAAVSLKEPRFGLSPAICSKHLYPTHLLSVMAFWLSIKALYIKSLDWTCLPWTQTLHPCLKFCTFFFTLTLTLNFTDYVQFLLWLLQLCSDLLNVFTFYSRFFLYSIDCASTVFANVTNQLFSALGQAAASPVNQG